MHDIALEWAFRGFFHFKRNQAIQSMLLVGLEEAKTLWCSDFEALTTNNTLLNKEVQKGIYDDLISEIGDAIREVAPKIVERMLVLEVAFVLNAYHALKLAS